MEDNWSKIFNLIILNFEGGAGDNSGDTHDKGQYTRYGISSRFWGDKIDVLNCTEQEAKDFYKKYLFSRIETKHEALNMFLFDSLVQHDRDACIWLQEAIGLKGKQVDGIIGSGTKAVLDKVATSIYGGEKTILRDIAAKRMQHYMDLDDGYAERYHSGWSRRFVDVLAKSLDLAIPF